MKRLKDCRQIGDQIYVSDRDNFKKAQTSLVACNIHLQEWSDIPNSMLENPLTLQWTIEDAVGKACCCTHRQCRSFLHELCCVL